MHAQFSEARKKKPWFPSVTSAPPDPLVKEATEPMEAGEGGASRISQELLFFGPREYALHLQAIQ